MPRVLIQVKPYFYHSKFDRNGNRKASGFIGTFLKAGAEFLSLLFL